MRFYTFKCFFTLCGHYQLFLNIKCNFVIMFYSISTETKDDFKSFLNENFRLLIKQMFIKFAYLADLVYLQLKMRICLFTKHVLF